MHTRTYILNFVPFQRHDSQNITLFTINARLAPINPMSWMKIASLFDRYWPSGNGRRATW